MKNIKQTIIHERALQIWPSKQWIEVHCPVHGFVGKFRFNKRISSAELTRKSVEIWNAHLAAST